MLYHVLVFFKHLDFRICSKHLNFGVFQNISNSKYVSKSSKIDYFNLKIDFGSQPQGLNFQTPDLA